VTWLNNAIEKTKFLDVAEKTVLGLALPKAEISISNLGNQKWLAAKKQKQHKSN
jgi:hypothetical protein